VRTPLLYRVLSLLAISSRDLGVFCSYSLYRVFGTAVLVLSAFPPLTRYNIFLGITTITKAPKVQEIAVLFSGSYLSYNGRETGLTVPCLSCHARSCKLSSGPLIAAFDLRRLKNGNIPYIRVTKQVESVVGSGGCRLKPFLIRKACKWKIKWQKFALIGNKTLRQSSILRV